MTADGLGTLYGLMDLEATIEALAPAILRYSAVVCGDVHRGEDVAQEALASLVRRWERYGPPDSPRSYALCAARRIARRTRWRLGLLDRLTANSDTARPEPRPDIIATWRQQLELVRAALAQLPTREREALLLVSVAELPTSEAASLLGVSQSALKMRVHRARKHLKETLRRNHGTRKSAIAENAIVRVR